MPEASHALLVYEWVPYVSGILLPQQTAEGKTPSVPLTHYSLLHALPQLFFLHLPFFPLLCHLLLGPL